MKNKKKVKKQKIVKQVKTVEDLIFDVLVKKFELDKK